MKKNSIFRWGVAMLLLFTGLSLRAYAEDDGGSPFRKNHDVDLTVKSATLQTFTDAFTKQTGVLFSYESALASMPMGDGRQALCVQLPAFEFARRGAQYRRVHDGRTLRGDLPPEITSLRRIAGWGCSRMLPRRRHPEQTAYKKPRFPAGLFMFLQLRYSVESQSSVAFCQSP